MKSNSLTNSIIIFQAPFTANVSFAISVAVCTVLSCVVSLFHNSTGTVPTKPCVHVDVSHLISGAKKPWCEQGLTQ